MPMRGVSTCRLSRLRVVAMGRPHGSIFLHEGAIGLGRAEPDEVHALRRGPGHAVDVARRVPERRIRTLERRQLHRDVVVAVVLATVGQPRARQAGDDHLERFLEHRARARRIEAVIADLVGGHAAPHAELEPSAAQVVEHADLADQPEGRVQGQQIDERAQPNAARALRRGGEEHRRRRRHAERRGVMLGQVIAEESRRFRLLQELQPIFVELAERSLLPPIDPVEHPEVRGRHRSLRSDLPGHCRTGRGDRAAQRVVTISARTPAAPRKRIL